MKIIFAILVASFCATTVFGAVCTYGDVDGKYTCTITTDVSTTDVTGTHTTSKSAADVFQVIVQPSITSTALIPKLLTTFTNMQVMRIENFNDAAGLVSTNFAACAKLSELHVSGTLSVVEGNSFSACTTTLKHINFTKNAFIALTANAFNNAANLVNLNVANNRISVDPTTSSIFASSSSNSVPYLTSFNISGNEIATLPTTFYLPSKILTIIDFSWNKLTEFPARILEIDANAVKLEEVYLNDNEITAIPEALFSKSTSLKVLNVGGNKITAFSSKALTKNVNLLSLNISKSQINTLEQELLGSLTKLTNLDMSSIGINSTSQANLKAVLAKMPDLKVLNISSNNVGSINDIFTSNTKLVELNINSMGLESISNEIFTTLVSLDTLNMNRNALTSLPDNVFEKTTALKILHANNNKITILKSSMFEKLTNLEYLDLSNNEIDKIEGTFFEKLTKLKVLKFSSNKCVNADFTDVTNTTLTKFQNCFDNYKNGAATFIISNVLLIFALLLKFA